MRKASGGRRAIKAQLLYDRSSPGLGWIVELAVLLAWTKRYLTSRCRDVVAACACLVVACYGSRLGRNGTGRARSGLSVGFREVRDGAGQVREQISARRMECELARPEGDSVWYGGAGSGSRQNVVVGACAKPGSLQ